MYLEYMFLQHKQPSGNPPNVILILINETYINAIQMLVLIVGLTSIKVKSNIFCKSFCLILAAY